MSRTFKPFVHTKQVGADWLWRWICKSEAVPCWWFESYCGKDLFCNVHLFRVSRSWTGGVQMKSSMTFLRGNRCKEREREKYKFYNGREVKHLKKWALALSFSGWYISGNVWNRLLASSIVDRCILSNNMTSPVANVT